MNINLKKVNLLDFSNEIKNNFTEVQFDRNTELNTNSYV